MAAGVNVPADKNAKNEKLVGEDTDGEESVDDNM